MNDRRRQGRTARRGGCQWLGFTFGLRTRWLFERGEDGGKSPTVRYWRMISCLHSSDPVSNEGEMRAGPIWNNRIPFAIVFLSVSLSLDPMVDTNAYRLLAYLCVCGYKCIRAWIKRKKNKETEREIKIQYVHVPSFVMRRIYGSRAIMFSAYREKFTCDYATGTRIRPARIMLLLRFSWKASSARRQRVVKEIPRLLFAHAPWHIAVRCMRYLEHNLSSIQMRNDVT